MADLTYAELKRVWLDVSQGTTYHTNAWASLMAAIAEAESAGDPNATNPNDNNGTQTSWGLWQISDGTHNPVSSNWASPVVNGQLALAKLQGQGLGAWGTYTSGAYKAYLSDSTTASGSIPPTGGTATQATAELTAAEAASEAAAPGQCALGYDQHVGIFFGHGPTISFCVISKTQVRALMGGLYITAGGLTTLVGVAILLVVAVPRVAATPVGQLAKAGQRVTRQRIPDAGPRYQARHRMTEAAE